MSPELLLQKFGYLAVVVGTIVIALFMPLISIISTLQQQT